ncbi:hypothetical protein N1851_019261 [Merluccius polli]|uniref:Uncharacterized protein n=1 Tax=Merluccius polli TaxID=89951 RepID=A0AA47MMJ3_MERPO|nr:hypothetical protein N1851_019261 [Merluccius polli]
MGRVKEELLRMGELGHHLSIEQPTDWCAGMVVVPNGIEKVRICVALTNLNENVCRELHILPFNAPDYLYHPLWALLPSGDCPLGSLQLQNTSSDVCLLEGSGGCRMPDG